MSSSAPQPDTGPDGVAPRPTDAVVRVEAGEARVAGRTIWSGVNLEIGPGEFTAVLGPNGAGKTTLLRVLLGDLRLAAGRASVLGRAPGEARGEMGYLPQRHHFDPGVRIRGIDLVRLGLDGARWGLPLGGSWRAPVMRAIERCDASAYASRPVGRLSGGEQQRLLIAQALVAGPRLLMLDEPLDSLDLPNQDAVTALLADICHQQRVTVLLVAHDVNPLLPYLDRVVYFGGGQAAAGAPSEVITAPTLSRLYGVPIQVLHGSDGEMFVAGLPEAPARHTNRHARNGH